jgi:hypothetical protein
MMTWQLQRVLWGHNPHVCTVCRRPILLPLACQREAVAAGVVPRWQARWLLGVTLPPAAGQGQRPTQKLWQAWGWRECTAAAGASLAAVAVAWALRGAVNALGGGGGGGWGWPDLWGLFSLQFDPDMDTVDVAAYAC